MKILAHPRLPKSSNYALFQFLIILLLLLSNVSFGQTDPQWYILHGGGRSSSSIPYLYDIPITNVFNIQGVTHPNRACNILAKNELFIIYSDGTHFNSRENANSVNVYPVDFFYPKIPNSTVLGSTIHHFQALGNKSVLYLYKTSKYEGDEPPNTIRVNIVPRATGSDTIYKPGTTNTTSILSASHDVVKDKDITLIVDYDELINQFGIDSSSSYYLQYDKVQSRASGAGIISHPEFFQLEPVFIHAPTNVSSYPANTIVKIPSEAKLLLIDPGSKYIYINLHPSTLLTSFYPNTIAGTVRYDALFDIYKHTRIDEDDILYDKVVSHSEQIRLSHDPNKLAVQSICKKLKQTFICYHLEFTNTSFSPAQNIEVEMDFPNDFVDECITISSWRIGGDEISGGEIVLCEGKIKAIFPPHLTLAYCQSDLHRDLCSGSLDFCIKVNTTEDVRNLEYNIEPAVNIYFDGVAYPINHFIDPFIQETSQKEFSARRPTPVTDCEAHCNFFCYPCRPCVKYPVPMILISLSVITLSWLFYRRLRLKKANKLTN